MYRKLLVLLCLFFLVKGEASAQGIVTFTFDDASQSQYDNAFRIMKDHSLAGTLFVPAGNLDARSPPGDIFNMTWDNVREMAAAGWEIGSHSHTHANLVLADDLQLFAELAFSKRRIHEEVGKAPVSLASPFGEADERVIAEVKKHYDFHFRAWGGNEGFNPFFIQTSYDIGRFDVKSVHSAEFVCGAITRASVEKIWLVLEFHQVVNEDVKEYQISVETFKGIVKCARSLRDQGRIRVKTAAEALSVLKGDSQ